MRPYAVVCPGCGGTCRVEGKTAVCGDCGAVGFVAEPGLSPRERYAARRRLDEAAEGWKAA